ncbi:hypothetical protein CEXT_252871 [Caerostris extrusa]|uniref:Uncharacterized protein n=1 Tax=Caerostris extrusa TaxID=172846 RepID=A0AAV4U6V6_CAEEX|nr:hypothetical protein CEXT_252871 [Caerostris extrusa]
MINNSPDLSRADLMGGSSLQMLPRELLLTPGTFHLEQGNIFSFSGVRVPSRRPHLSSSSRSIQERMKFPVISSIFIPSKLMCLKGESMCIDSI